tara:strand:- start:412 stop:687 length:276 start_codon:yes stop_codon:yes gene_type:complete
MQTTSVEKDQIRDSIMTLITSHIDSAKSPKDVTSLYSFMIELIEPPLLEAVMEKAKWNQVRAAKLLGLSRGTFRKKLKTNFDDRYCGSRED